MGSIPQMCLMQFLCPPTTEAGIRLFKLFLISSTTVLTKTFSLDIYPAAKTKVTLKTNTMMVLELVFQP